MSNNYPYNSIEKALAMCKENVSPSETSLQAILSQIPEQQNLKEGRAVRSPYRWLALSQLVTTCALLLILIPSTKDTEQNLSLYSNPYYEVDKEVELFEAKLDEEDVILSLHTPLN